MSELKGKVFYLPEYEWLYAKPPTKPNAVASPKAHPQKRKRIARTKHIPGITSVTPEQLRDLF